MRKTSENLTNTTTVFCTALLTSNVIASTGASLVMGKVGGVQLLAVPAVIAYAMTFLSTDIISQIWGKEQANKTVKTGFIASIIMSIIIALTPLVLKPWFEGTELYTAMNSIGGLTIASLIGYICSQSWDVYIFHRIKSYFKDSEKYKWIWNNASTISSQLIDTVIFLTGAYILNAYGIADVKTLISLIIGQYVVKVVIALLDTPFFYLFTRVANNED